MFIHEKIKNNKWTLLWAIIGLFGVQLLILSMWISVLFLTKIRVDIFILVPVAFTIFWSFMSGFMIRGIEIHSIGIDINRMDQEEIDIAIGLLQKNKRLMENEELKNQEKPKKK
jgi:hypothetical protein